MFGEVIHNKQLSSQQLIEERKNSMDTKAQREFRKEMREINTDKKILKKALESETQRVIKNKLYQLLRKK